MTGSDELRDKAAHRLDILARQLDRVGLADLAVVTEGRSADREALRRRAVGAATAAGLGDVLADARSRFRDWLQAAYNRIRSDLEVIQVARGSSLGSVADRVDAFLAVDDAVIATVAFGLIPEDARDGLLEPLGRMLAARPPRRAVDRGSSGPAEDGTAGA
jgi:hypothetical protein